MTQILTVCLADDTRTLAVSLTRMVIFVEAIIALREDYHTTGADNRKQCSSYTLEITNCTSHRNIWPILDAHGIWPRNLGSLSSHNLLARSRHYSRR